MGKSNIEDSAALIVDPSAQTLDERAAVVKAARADVATKSAARNAAINALPETAALNASVQALAAAQAALAAAVAAASGQPQQAPRANPIEAMKARRAGLQRLPQR